MKWIEDKSGNLSSTGFGRDMYLDAQMALRSDGKILAVRMHADTDQGAFFADAQPSKFKVGLLHSAFACYDVPVGLITAQGQYTNKAPGGVAYRCSFRVTEAMFFQERMVAAAAADLGIDAAEFRRDQPAAPTTSSRTAPRSASSSTPGSTTSAWISDSTRSATRSSSATRPRPANAAGCSASGSRP